MLSRFCPWLKNASVAVWLFPALLVAGCQCNLKNAQSSARVVVTHITAPPGGGSQRFLEVKGSGWHPNEQIRIAIPEMPTTSGFAPLEEFTTTDGAGNFYWKKDPVTYVPPTSGADPEKILTVGVSEPKSGCFSATSIKLGEFMTL